MSAPPRADYVAGCPDCSSVKGADCIEDVAGFYRNHHSRGHEVEWMWGVACVGDVDVEVTDAGSVANLSAIIESLETLFHPAEIPAELVYETCLNEGAMKEMLAEQLDGLPSTVADRVGSLD